MFAELMRRIPTKSGAGRVLILVNAVTLAIQASETVSRMFPGLSVEIEQGARYTASGNADVTVATVQSMCSRSRLDKYDPSQFKCVIIDEAHHAAANTYRKILARFNSKVRPPFHEIQNDDDMGEIKNAGFPLMVPIIGFSATFSRHDGRALGTIFDEIVFHRDFFEMIEDKWLSPLRFTAIRGRFDLSGAKSTGGDFVTSSLARIVNQPEVNEIIVRTWLDRAYNSRRSTLVFAVNIEHVEALVCEFRARNVEAHAVHSGIPLKKRDEIVQDFRDGKFPVLINCAVLTEGADIPPVDCVLLARPTKSRNLFSQMIGRGLRLSPVTGKTDCLVLDVVGNTTHGVVCTPMLFGLDHWDEIDNATIAELRQLRKMREEKAAKESPATVKLPEYLEYIDYTDPRQLLAALAARGDPPSFKLSPNAWVDCGDHRHVLGSYDGSYVRVERSNTPGEPIWQGVYIQRNPMFGISDEKSPYLHARKIVTSNDLGHAIRGCDTFLAEHLTASGRTPKYLLRSAAWRGHLASKRAQNAVQKVLAGRGKNKLETNIDLEQLTQGDVDIIITRARHGARSRLMKQAKVHNTIEQALLKKAVRAFKKHQGTGNAGAAGAGAGFGAGAAAGMGGVATQMPPNNQYGYGPAMQDAPGGPAPWTAQILGTDAVHPFDDNNKNAQNEYYKNLRNSARSEGDKMGNAFRASKEAYRNGDGARAKQLSEEGNMHQQRMEQLNAQAAEWIYAANNADSPPGTIDLHGLYVKEAIAKAEQVLQQARAQNYPQLRIIVGKGIHSKDHVSHIKPAVERLVRDYNVSAHVDPKNTGVLIVNMNGPAGGGGADFTRDMARGATGNDQECVVM
ncbi:Putative ATP-dependent helicase IRC3 [Malassezia cuniculi]|uniref:ATP-dependent helicase IRC3 n=1 Tax=Malassezia cuniculi TaxID=948313 RepID=A0AAF0J5W9_9BASI|nr:Putative ATP-dependent helicase IRC3 [Malassezia cuniculi]